MKDDALSSLSPDAARLLLPGFLAATVVPERRGAVKLAMEELLARTGEEDLAAALGALSRAGETYERYPADPFARRLSRLYMACLVEPDSGVIGLEHLQQAVGLGPVLLLGNHRSYVDTQLTDLLIARQDPALADRLLAVAGPKVYADTFRRIAAIGLNTLKTAQSVSVASEQALSSGREVARIAAQTVRQAEERMRAGDAVLLYAEGTRSRDGRLGPFLRGASRYARLPGLRVLPLALQGSEQVYPIDSPVLFPARVRLAFAPPFLAEGLDRDALLERARAEILRLLGA
jgi:1-acyl-sn-glycerol-3-phosphate acyltransferase